METSLEWVRKQIRENKWTTPTAGLAPGYTQANLVILPKKQAYDFLLFCQRNPKACPLLEVTDAGSPVPRLTAPTADLRYDTPKYRIYRHGELVEEVTSLESYWQEDLVSFLIGCSFTFEHALLENGLSIRHIEEQRNVPMYITNKPCEPAGAFHGNLVVSMRPFQSKDVIRAVEVTSRFPAVHGSPVHIGMPEQIGIKQIDRPDFGDAVTIKEGETPVFWACGVTPQSIAMSSKPALMITHAPGHMFITDQKDSQYSIL
ncbi:putative hydro-lyase [Domibacillus sp. A3M-37]|uniref:putative hydro-lyase n=1 Tax=Domibacillus sp. A3M-37 TaxID=2962037 RepID=UPI0020B757EF|nr:putative hydro-lyase [Domibacillus sp. A3M-37]MCP3762184.1 putative hydro-lyase [Domibacillus sp. A3M-37]